MPAALVVCSVGGVALASRAGDDRARAEATLGRLRAVPAHARLAHEPLKQAEQALGRASDARAAGDQVHAPELEALGREWADTGADLVRAAQAEKQLGEVQRELADAETKITRARALLEQTIGRRGRAREKLEELEKKP